jgi:hypothetical protein
LTDQPKKSAPRASPMRRAMPIVLGLAVGVAGYGVYDYVSQQNAEQKALAAAPPDSSLAKPSAEECAIARAALTALHAAGSDTAWRKAADAQAMTLEANTRVVNPTDVAGYTDDEARDLRGKLAADWRGCQGMAAFVSGLGWSAMGGDAAIPAMALGRPAMDKTGDEARLYEAFSAPDAQTGALFLARGPWLATLHRGADGAWRVVSTADLKHIKP